jgi:hypothetical protein
MKRKIVMVPLGIAAMFLFAFLGTEIVLHLWNWLAPEVFGLHIITFWQALGLLVLCRILFGSHGFGRRCGRGRLHDKWEKMSPEDRDRFREGMRSRFGGPSSAAPNPNPTT